MEIAEMVCKHLITLEEELISNGFTETFRGKAWSEGCREWVYFDCIIDTLTAKKMLDLPESVIHHEHLGTHDGQEFGLVCDICNDGIMGLHPKHKVNVRRYP